MERRLIPLNAVIGLYSETTTSWPRPFADAGYRLEAIEFPIEVDGEGRVVADAIGFKTAESRFALHEAKSGTSVDASQARRYSLADPAFLVRTLSVTITSADVPRAQGNYVCMREHEDRVLWQLREAGVELPVLSLGASDITAVGAEFDDPALRAAFGSPIPVTTLPPALVTVDADSSDDDFDQIVFPSLIAAASMRIEQMSVERLTEESIPPYPLFPGAYKRRLRVRVAESAQRAAEADPARWQYQRRGAGDEGLVRVLVTPEDADPRGRTQQYQSMRTRLQSRGRRRTRPEIPGQASFFVDDAQLERELDETRSVDEDAREEDR